MTDPLFHSGAAYLSSPPEWLSSWRASSRLRLHYVENPLLFFFSNAVLVAVVRSAVGVDRKNAPSKKPALFPFLCRIAISDL